MTEENNICYFCVKKSSIGRFFFYLCGTEITGFLQPSSKHGYKYL